MLTLVVVAMNEADRIGACLDSVPPGVKRLVVDGGSVDATVDVARRHGADVIHHPWPGFVAQKRFGWNCVQTPWALSLDADERLDATAREAVAAWLLAPSADGGRWVRRNRWLGQEVHHGRFGPDAKVRLARTDRGRWEGVDPHDELVVDGIVVDLAGAIVHDPYRSLADHLARIGRYAEIHAQGLHDRGVRARSFDLVVRPIWHAFDAFVLRRGFLDGRVGWILAALGAIRVLAKWTALWRLGASRS